MTWVQWTLARRLLYEEHLGTHLRASENQKAAEYARSVAALKRHEPSTLE